MGWPFGSKKDKEPIVTNNKKAPDVNTSIQKLTDSEDTLMKRDAVLTKKIAQELAAARAAQQKGNKTLALRHLKQKKAFEEQQTRLSAQIGNLSAMRMKMEEMQTTTIVASALSTGANDLTGMQKNLNIDKLDDVMDKVGAAMDDANDLADRLAQPLGNDLMDEDELLAELDELDQLDLDEQMMQIGNVTTKVPGPGVTAGAQPTAVEEEEDELAALERAMNA